MFPTASITVGEDDVGSNDTSSLRAYTTYSVTVVAFSDKWGKTVGSEATRVTTLQRGSAAVTGRVTVGSLSSTVISVQWSGLSPCRLVNGVIVRYRVQYRAKSSGVVAGSKEVAGNWSSGAETELSGLTPSTNYSIAVAAVNEQGDVGVYSHPVTVRTLPGSTSKESRNSVIIGATMACIGIVLGFSGAVIGCLFYNRSSLEQRVNTKVNTEDNQAYGVHETPNPNESSTEETKDE
ncbi:Receptor-type tyrosine-protein phosphatase F [Geodia barretti]|uniref:Receptor-type tyrosine-protein phosphatase F n=1 Tax=Geodia barretti TaxID=519541 RepID=A0AA35S3S8_GEOBA|nr:Receptor-type tyrosine-protein phosphatase F [Geodia barretti]